MAGDSEVLSPKAARFRVVLKQHGLACVIKEFPAGTRTAQQAADAIGCHVGQIVKSLVFRADSTQHPVLVLTSGKNRVNEDKIRLLIQEPLAKADADFVREQTGFAIGGVPPFGHTRTIQTFLDADLLAYAEVWAAAGTPNTVFCLDPNVLPAITQGTVTSVT